MKNQIRQWRRAHGEKKLQRQERPRALAGRGAPAARQRHERQVDRIGDTRLGEDGARRIGHLLAAASPGLADPEEVDRRGGHGGEEEEHFRERSEWCG